jgi:hypothetical protein
MRGDHGCLSIHVITRNRVAPLRDRCATIRGCHDIERMTGAILADLWARIGVLWGRRGALEAAEKLAAVLEAAEKLRLRSIGNYTHRDGACCTLQDSVAPLRDSVAPLRDSVVAIED